MSKQTIKQRKKLGTGSAKAASRSPAETPTAEVPEMDQDIAKFELRRLQAIDREQAYAAMDYRVYRQMVEARAAGKPWPPAPTMDDPAAPKPGEMVRVEAHEMPGYRPPLWKRIKAWISA